MNMLDKYRIIPRMADGDGGAGAGAGAGAAGDNKGAGAGGAAAGGDKGAGAGAGAAAGGDKGAGAGAGAGGDKGAGAGDPWHKPFNLDQKAVDYLDGKGIRDLGGLLKVTQDFETVARDRNVVPKPDPAKLAEWEGHELLGWVKDRTKYAPKEPTRKEGQVYDPTMFKDFVDVAHAERVPVAAVERIYQGMYDKMQARIAELDGQQKKDAAEAKTKLDTDLRGKWGDKFDANSEIARRALRALGVSEAQSNKLNAIMGDAALVEIFHNIGSKLGEDTLAAGAGGTVQMTSANARAQRLKLESDPEWLKIFQDQRHPLYQQHKEERERLLEIEARTQQRAA